jgi:3-oxoacyl-ACP reductase-like protein
MMRRFHAPLLVLLGVIAAEGTIAQDVPACADIVDNMDRLACFDGQTMPETATNSEVAPAAETSAAPANEPTSAPAAASEAAATMAPAEAPADHSAGEKEEIVEAQAATSTSVEAEEQEQPDQFTAIVTGVDRRPLGQHVVVLDNGQTWSQQTAESYFPVEIGDTITIKKRMFSGYRLIAENGNAIKVERYR